MTRGDSALLDMRDCQQPEWARINRRVASLESQMQPLWFRPFFAVSYIRRGLGYNNSSRLWEYSWALVNARLQRGMRVIDIGSGGSPFPLLLAQEGCEVHAADPTLDNDIRFEKGWKARAIRSLGIALAWGMPPPSLRNGVTYVPDSIQNLRYPEGYFDRVFCLSVMEHIPEVTWPACMAQMCRLLRDEGYLVLTLDMTTPEADQRRYRKLMVEPSLKLLGEVNYSVPISSTDKQIRHPGRTYETVGLIWSKQEENL